MTSTYCSDHIWKPILRKLICDHSFFFICRPLNTTTKCWISLVKTIFPIWIAIYSNCICDNLKSIRFNKQLSMSKILKRPDCTTPEYRFMDQMYNGFYSSYLLRSCMLMSLPPKPDLSWSRTCGPVDGQEWGPTGDSNYPRPPGR
jgi:hypothetical protein